MADIKSFDIKFREKLNKSRKRFLEKISFQKVLLC